MPKPPRPTNRGASQEGGDSLEILQARNRYSQEQMLKSEEAITADVGETYRQIKRQAERVEAGEAKVPRVTGVERDTSYNRLRKSTNEYLMRTGQAEEEIKRGTVVGRSLPAVTKDAYIQNRLDQADQILLTYQNSRQGQDLTKFPYLANLVKEMNNDPQVIASGQKLTADDLGNLVLWGQLDSAARRYVQLVELGYTDQADKIAEGLADPNTGNIAMASMFPTVVEEVAKEMLGLDMRDPETVDTFWSKAGEWVGKGLDVAMAPSEAVTSYSRAMSYGAAIGETVPFLGISPTTGLKPQDNWYEATSLGKFNDSYINQLVGDPAEGKYTQLEVDLAKEIIRKSVLGSAQPIAETWNEQENKTDPEVASFFRDVQVGFSENATRINELMRQIQSVDLSNTAAVSFYDAADPDLQYDPARGEEWYAKMLGVSEFGTIILSDPLNFLPMPIRSGKAARWALDQLAPGAKDFLGNPLRAENILQKKNLLGVNIHTGASRYFTNFAEDLNKLDALEKRAAKAVDNAENAKLSEQASTFRQRMSRQYDEMPEELIESFRNHMTRNDDGVFDLDTVAKYIDDTNDTYLAMRGDEITKAMEEGVLDLADNLVLEKFLAERPLFVDAVASTTQTRARMIPRRGPIGTLRVNAVNSIISDLMPTGNARRIIDEVFDPNATTAEIAMRLDEQFVEVGRMIKKNKGQGRWFSSIPSGLVISLDNAAGAKEFYRFARQFMDRHMAAFLTDAYRTGTAGSRRMLVAATVRSGMFSRGVPMTRAQVDEWMTRSVGSPTKPGDGQVTGSRSGEAYSVFNPDGSVPSQKLSTFRKLMKSLRPAGEQVDVAEAAAPLPGILEDGTVRRVLDENNLPRLSVTRDQYLDSDKEFNDLFNEVIRLSNDPDASVDEINELMAKASEREAYLRGRYDIEEQLIEVDRGIADMPKYTISENGIPIPEPVDVADEFVDARAREMLRVDEDNGLIGTPSPETFETPSGVFMTPTESEYFVKYGFLLESYLRRAFKNMESANNAVKIDVKPLTRAEKAATPANVSPNGGLEVFNFRLVRDDVDDAAQDYIYNSFELGPRSIETGGGLGEILARVEDFNPQRSIPGYKPGGGKLKPGLSTEEAVAIRDGLMDFDEVYRIVKTEGRTLSKAQAKLIRDKYGISVRGYTKRTQKPVKGVYIEWAENGTDAGKERLLQRYRDEVRAVDEDEYYSTASQQLDSLPALEKRQRELRAALASIAGKQLDQAADPATQAIVKNFDDTVAAKVNNQQPMTTNPADPILTAPESVAKGQRGGWSPSRDENGMEEAIHQYQIAKSVRIMSIQDIDTIKREAAFAGRFRLGFNEAITQAVDAWSFATLFGPRFSVRNAIEELLFYALTGGKVSDLYKGRRASTAQRQARPRFVYETAKDGTQRLVIKTNLGLVNRLSRGYTLTGRLRDDLNQEWLATFIGQYTDRTDFIKAQLAWQAGDPTPYTKLYAKALISSKTGILPTGLSENETQALLWLAGSQHGQKLVQNAAETGNSLLNGRLPTVTDDVARLQDLDPTEVDAIMSMYPSFGPGISPREFGALKPVTFSPENPNVKINGLWWWWREMQAIVHGDGPIGKMAIKYIADPETAKKAIADYVRTDTKWGYKEDWSMFSEGRDIDAAASRYYENVLRTFQKPNGEINWRLRNMFVERIDGEDVVSWYKPAEAVQGAFDDFSNGPKVHRVSVNDLDKIKLEDRPEFVFGRLPSAPEPIPTLTGIGGFFTKGYGILGRQNARISREPIFYANYLNMTRQTERAQANLAKSLAEAGGRSTPNEFDNAVAAQHFNKANADSAYAMTMAYVDNPANRSLLAWRVRNVARYYRATEDFYRRAKRLAVNYPEAYYRAALVYGLLDETGFVYEDEEGVKYFYYPGNEYVQNAFTMLSSVMPGINMMNMQVMNPFQVGGKIIGLSPSLDPKSAVPSMAGPMVFPVAAAFDMFPPLKELQGLRSIIVGPYVQPQSSILELARATLTPAGLQRLQQINQDQLDSSLQEAAYDTIKIMVATGKIDSEDLGTENGSISINEFMRSDLWKSAQGVAFGLWATKMVLSWLAPAAPQAYEGAGVSPVARELGISDFDTTFREILELNKDAVDPWAEATAMYYAAKIDKAAGKDTPYDTWDSLLPFTLSGSKGPEDKLAGLSGVQATDNFVKWTQSDEFKNLESLPGGADSIFWLAPKSGEFTWQSWYVVKNQYGLKVSKTVEEKLEQLFASEGQYRDTVIRKDYDQVISTLNPVDPEQKKEINRLEGLKQAERQANQQRNPYFNSLNSKGGQVYNQTRLAESVKQMEIFIASVKDSGYKMPSSLVAIDDSIRIFRDFREAMSGLGSKKDEKQRKEELRAEMNRVLVGIGQGDENAKRFIETVLDTLNYSELTQLDPLNPDVPQEGA